MSLSDTKKGYIFALAATISLANVYIFSKAALNIVNLWQFGFYWYGTAVICNFILTGLSGKYKNKTKLTKNQILTLAGMGIVEFIATVAIFMSIKTIANPSIPALIRNLEPILIIIISFFVLRERHSITGWAGVILTIIGTIIVSYNFNGVGNKIFIEGTWMVIVACIFYSVRTVWNKIVINDFKALTLNLNKIGFMFVASIIGILVTKSSFLVPREAIKYLTLGSIIGPFFTSLTQIISLKYINASQTTLVQSTAGFFTITFAFVFWGKLPYAYQIAGGVLSILGLIFTATKTDYIKKWLHLK